MIDIPSVTVGRYTDVLRQHAKRQTRDARLDRHTASKQTKPAKTNGRTTASYVVNFGFKSDVIVMNAPLLPI